MKMSLQEYSEEGFVLLKDMIPHEDIDSLLEKHLDVVNDIADRNFDDPFGSDLVEFYENNSDIESKIYDSTLRKNWLQEFSLNSKITQSVIRLLGENVGLFKKIPFRMDMPFWTKELALWHQDNYYVKGDSRGITAWIPMQDTTYVNGCLSIMPKSHLLGTIDHDLKIGKKHLPSTVFDREIRMVEMKKGDVLLFFYLTFAFIKS